MVTLLVLVALTLLGGVFLVRVLLVQYDLWQIGRIPFHAQNTGRNTWVQWHGARGYALLDFRHIRFVIPGISTNVMTGGSWNIHRETGPTREFSRPLDRGTPAMLRYAYAHELGRAAIEIPGHVDAAFEISGNVLRIQEHSLAIDERCLILLAPDGTVRQVRRL